MDYGDFLTNVKRAVREGKLPKEKKKWIIEYL